MKIEKLIVTFCAAVIAVCAAIMLVLLVGCTITPAKTKATQASYDGTNQNSGFLGFTNGYGVITPHARDRYNALIAVYGSRFTPALTHDAGLSPYFFDPPKGDNYRIDQQHLVYFMDMQRWRREGK